VYIFYIFFAGSSYMLFPFVYVALPESAAYLIVGIIIGLIAKFGLKDDSLFVFQPELFFFLMLPPIIFEAGYSLERKRFFENFGAILLYAMFGTLISTFVVGYMTFYAGKLGLVGGVDTTSPMEALVFGALISAVDPVATLSIMGSPELQCNQLLYSLIMGESVLNDAIAIVLFNTFRKYYDESNDSDGILPKSSNIKLVPMLVEFIVTSFLSICIGVILGLLCSFIYKHTQLSAYHNLEMSLLFLFCYGCYSSAEAMGLSGIMALFFNGIVLRHYNSYNLSKTANITAEEIFGTLATISETLVYLYMGTAVSFGNYSSWHLMFPIFALLFCVIGRAFNILPLSFVANLSRKGGRGSKKITWQMQTVLWFAGLRGAIAYALSINMPGPNKDNYVATTLFICISTTIFCGGYTERVLTVMGMKTREISDENDNDECDDDDALSDFIAYSPLAAELVNDISSSVNVGVKGAWYEFDNNHLKPLFGGEINHDLRYRTLRQSSDMIDPHDDHMELCIENPSNTRTNLARKGMLELEEVQK